MFSWLRRKIFGKELIELLNETRSVKVHGVRFLIRRVNMAQYADGSKVLLQYHDTYKAGKTNADPVSEKKLKEHFSHVLVAGLVDPALSHKEEGPGIFVEKMFTDWDLVVSLYNEIIEFTYGKKKLGRSHTQKKSSLKLIGSQEGTG